MRGWFTGKGVAEDSLTSRAEETVGFIVCEAGHGTIGGVEFETGLGTDTVRGIDNGPPFSYTYSTAFATAPTVAVASQAAVDGNDGGWVQTFGAAPSSASQLFLSIDEDQISNGERSHTTDQVGYAVFAGPVVYPLAPSCTEGQACDDGNACTTGDTCTGGACAGTPTDCSGLDDQCNTGVCNAGTGACEAQPANEGGGCDDGLFCNAGETCAAGSCAGGGATDCGDGVGCTTDSCNEGTDSCDNTPVDAACVNGQFCDGTETCSATLDCQSGADPCPGQGCNEATDQCLAGPVAMMEAGTVAVGGSPVTVVLVNSYTSPVVACTVPDDNNTTPVVTRVSAVGSSSFQVRRQHPSGGAVATDDVNCLVVEEGTWTIDGVNIEAQTYLSTLTDRRGSWNGQSQSYGQAYTSPVVIGQVMTENDANWSYFWSNGGSRQTPPSAAS